jgi:hypothetical protein
MFIRLGCAFVAFATLQLPPQPSRASGLVVGQVIDAASGRPVAGAIVSIDRNSPRVLTGNDGRFVFRDLRRGDYTIIAAKPGFAEGAYGRIRAGGASQSLTLNEGARVGDVVIRLWKHAAISGTIVDESGERLVGVQVRAYRRSVVAGRRRYIASSLGTTDDRGAYRIGGLLPADYIVGTLPRQTAIPLSMYRGQAPGSPARNVAAETGLVPTSEVSSGLMVIGDAGLLLARGMAIPPPVAGGRLAVYPATYHPSTSVGGSSTVITLRPGDEQTNADLQLTPVPTARVSGSLYGPEGPLRRATIRLVPTQTTEFINELDLAVTIADDNGSFIFPAVPAGHYTVHLSRAGLYGAQPDRSSQPWLDVPLSVGTDDIDGLVLSALPGVRLTGRVEFEGDMSRSRVQIQNIQILIEPADVMPGTAANFARPSLSGEFMSNPLPGGRYYLRIPNSPAGWMFKSATIDGRDVADIPFDLRQEPTIVTVTFTDRWSGVRGSVSGSSGRDSTALVLVFPTDRDAWGSTGLSPRRVRSTRASRTGEYSFNLPPGDYYVVAIPEEYSSEWQDPDFLDVMSRAAARVTIAEGERKVQDLRTREIR